MVSYVILGSHVTFYEAMTKINKTLPAAFGSIVKLTKGHVVSRKWVHQNGGSKHGPIVSDLKILRFGRASQNDQKDFFLKYYLKFWTSFLNFYLLDTVFCEPWLRTLKLRLVSTVVSLGTTKSVLCTRTLSVTKFMTYDSVGFKYWYKKNCWTFSHQNFIF